MLGRKVIQRHPLLEAIPVVSKDKNFLTPFWEPSIVEQDTKPKRKQDMKQGRSRI